MWGPSYVDLSGRTESSAVHSAVSSKRILSWAACLAKYYHAWLLKLIAIKRSHTH